MLSRLLLVLLLPIALLCSSDPADAARRVRLNNLYDQPIPAVNGQPAAVATIDDAMRRALAKHQWTIKDAQPGRIRAALVVRTKHFVEVEIRFDASKYSIVYLSSVNLNYRLDNKGERIHPNYHKWVRWLADSFLANLVAA